MKRNNLKNLCASVVFLSAFVLWTIAVSCIGVREIGPQGSEVGFATLNGFFHGLTDVNMQLYNITDWLGLVPVAVVISFAFLGLIQWIRRKHISKVDYSILVLGGFYVAVMAVYVLFEEVVINYRPVLIEGVLEASYPSSTTMLVMCVMPTAMMQLNHRVRNASLRKCLLALIAAFTAFMVIGRLISGVHWVTDIIGGFLVSVGLVMMYRFVVKIKE